MSRGVAEVPGSLEEVGATLTGEGGPLRESRIPASGAWWNQTWWKAQRNSFADFDQCEKTLQGVFSDEWVRSLGKSRDEHPFCQALMASNSATRLIPLARTLHRLGLTDYPNLRISREYRSYRYELLVAEILLDAGAKVTSNPKNGDRVPDWLAVWGESEILVEAKCPSIVTSAEEAASVALMEFQWAASSYFREVRAVQFDGWSIGARTPSALRPLVLAHSARRPQARNSLRDSVRGLARAWAQTVIDSVERVPEREGSYVESAVGTLEFWQYHNRSGVDVRLDGLQLDPDSRVAPWYRNIVAAKDQVDGVRPGIVFLGLRHPFNLGEASKDLLTFVSALPVGALMVTWPTPHRTACWIAPGARAAELPAELLHGFSEYRKPVFIHDNRRARAPAPPVDGMPVGAFVELLQL